MWYHPIVTSVFLVCRLPSCPPHCLTSFLPYRNTNGSLKTQLEREPRPFPTLKIARSLDEIKDIDGFRFDDFVIEGYNPMGKIEMKMSVSGVCATRATRACARR